jgi:hypothetical protein
MSSRLVRDAQGRPMVEMTTAGEPRRRFRVVRTEFGAGPDSSIAFTGHATGGRLKPMSSPGMPGPDGWLIGDERSS